MSEYLLESEPEASDFSGETSSFEFSLSNSANSNEEELVSVDSTVEPYQFEPVGASTRTRRTRTAMMVILATKGWRAQIVIIFCSVK